MMLSSRFEKYPETQKQVTAIGKVLKILSVTVETYHFVKGSLKLQSFFGLKSTTPLPGPHKNTKENKQKRTFNPTLAFWKRAANKAGDKRLLIQN